ncbi:hypothetical protein ACGFZP_21235 [Kitasatospora sp. NPDC048239]|uniref:hypothetical protein n=1 Tax=Kitasatospora sp. NPDC048239 TaxID=3364046 RepID=UPI0037126792
MADEAGGAARAPMVWALAVRSTESGPPYAEVIVEVGPRLHGDLLSDLVDSGFTIAAGEPPDTTGVVETSGSRLARLVLVGGRQVWEPASPVEASEGWLAAAEGRGGVIVIVVPPGTWPPGLMELEPQARIDVFTRSLELARAAGRVFHGMTAVETGSADPEYGPGEY